MKQLTSGDAHERTERPDSFPIVAVGASAGGLGPTMELVRELGAEPGLALVIVHHLDPMHDSGLVEILSRATPMPVAAASDGLRVEVNRIYVVPPNAGLLIEQRNLRVVPRVKQGGLHLPINLFFESLALDCGDLSACVVLSGSGFDGTEGIKAIKRQGGITLAQDATAQYDSMPQSAIATGCVDLILPPAGLARELRRLGAQGPSLAASPRAVDDDPVYMQILAAMRRASGVDFSSYKHTTIRRRMERRLFFRGMSELNDYLALLQRDPAEVAALCEEVLIHVTGFFRDPEAFEVLRTTAFPKLCEGRKRDAPLRVWVPGCSTGEEVYSIAMCLREYLDEAHLELPIKIFGTDLSTGVIEKARAGRYAASIESEVSEARLLRFFSKTDGGYQIRRDLRDLCVFAKHDLGRDPPFASMDLISCRNLMIYFGPELQERVIALLHYALKEPGFLLLGSAETVRAFAGFSAVDGRNKLYARTSAAPRLAFDFTTSRHSIERPSAAASMSAALDTVSSSRSPGAADVHRAADRLVLAQFAPPGVVVTDDLAILQFRGHTGRFLEHAPGAASLDLLRTAREELRLPLRRAVDLARTSGTRIRETGVVLSSGDKPLTLDIEVIPFAVHTARAHHLLVLFEELPGALPAPLAPAVAPIIAAIAPAQALEHELSSTRQYLESVIEQLEATNEELKASNEEVVSSNEELRSTNEELQSAKEDLQATNEEMRTVHDEMRVRSVESTRLSDDLTNVLTSIEIPILLVGRDLRVRKFTPAAGRMFGLRTGDVGRAISEVPGIASIVPSLTQALPNVLEQLRGSQSRVQDPSGHWYELSVRPYLTLDARVDGMVLVARDVDAETRSSERVETARAYAQSVVDTVRESLVVLDREHRIVSANRAFLQTFHVSEQAITGQRLDALGRPELAAADLSKLFEELATSMTIDGFRIERGDESGQAHAFLLNARQIEGTERLLLAFEDVSEVQTYREELRRMAFEAAVSEERERRRIAIALHDQMGQSLALAQIKLSSVSGELVGEARAAVDAAVQLLEQSILDARMLIFDLSPPILYDLGLEQALAWLAEDLGKRHGIQIELSNVGTSAQLDDVAKGVVFRAVRELLMNVLKHAKAPTAKVSVTQTGAEFHVDVEDRGAGFDTNMPLGSKSSGGFGLMSVRAQLARLGGGLDVKSNPGQGTCVSIRLPLVQNIEAPGTRANAEPESTP